LKISVVTISYNQAEYLARCIESVLAQEGPEVDYIVVDGGSTDGSRQIIERYRDRLAHVVIEKDDGPGDALNKGLRLSSGELFYYLNSDDEVAPGAFREAAALFEKNPQTDVVYGNGVMIDANGAVGRKLYSSMLFAPRLYASGLAVVVQQSTFVRTEALRAVGGFNPSNRTCWDGESFLALAVSGARFMRTWRFWGRFRVYPESISGSGRTDDQYHRDHDAICAKRGLKAYPRVLRTLLWACLRIADIRRWTSYLKGRVRLADLASAQSR
jgi:glycosyltransferase involved in cell wall biosynthesis